MNLSFSFLIFPVFNEQHGDSQSVRHVGRYLPSQRGQQDCGPALLGSPCLPSTTGLPTGPKLCVYLPAQPLLPGVDRWLPRSSLWLFWLKVSNSPVWSEFFVAVSLWQSSKSGMMAWLISLLGILDSYIHESVLKENVWDDCLWECALSLSHRPPALTGQYFNQILFLIKQF